MDTIRCARPDEYQAIMRLLAEAYGCARDAFPRHNPMVWREDTIDYAHILLIAEKDRIVSLVRVFPMELVLGPARVRVGGIGGVATAPAWRGKGCMEQLMRRALEVMRAEAFPISILWGDRHRYQLFGYEEAGQKVSFNLRPRGLDKVGILPLPGEVYSGQADVRALMAAAYDRQPFRKVRSPRDVESVYQREGLRVYFHRKGDTFGYLVLSGDQGPAVVEFGGGIESVLGLARQVMEQNKLPGLTLVAPEGIPVPPLLLRAASGWNLAHACMAAILDLPRTLEAFRPQCEALPPGFDLPALASCSATEQVHRLFGSLGKSPFHLFVMPLDQI